MKNFLSFCSSLFKPKMFLLWALFLVGVLPFVLLAPYAHPSADDWYQAAATMQVGFIAANVDYYIHMTGRYFSSLLLFSHPMLLSFAAFKVYSFLLVTAFVPAMLWAAVRWFPSASRLWQVTVGLTVLVAFLGGMPSPAQAFYWQTGSAGYIIPALLFLCLAAVLGRDCLAVDWRPSLARTVVCCLLAIFITGSSEIAMALLLLFLVILNVVRFRIASKVSLPLVAMLVCVVVGIFFVMLAPGNSVRIRWYSNDVHHSPVKAVLMAGMITAKQVLAWLAYGPFFLFSLLLLAGWPVETGATRKRAWEMIFWAVVLMGGTIFGGSFVGTWSMGDYLPLRSTNLLYLFFVFGWVVFVGGIATLLRSYEVKVPRLGPVLATGLFVVFLGLAAAGPHRPMWGGFSNIKNAWTDLLNGGASAYDKECYARYAIIQAATTDDVVVPPLKARPRSLLFSDLHVDPENWRNVGMSRFFRKHSIIMK